LAGNYTPTTLGGTKLEKNYVWGKRRKKVEYHCSRQVAHRAGEVKPYAPAALYSQEDFGCSFLLEAESTPRL
jgi:hypothetical protein